MTQDEEWWAAAVMVLRIHGDRAHLHVAERIGALALAGDTDGIAAWQAIAARLEQVIDTSAATH